MAKFANGLKKSGAASGATTPRRLRSAHGLEFERYFTDGRTPPFDAVASGNAGWRSSAMKKGQDVFRQKLWKAERLVTDGDQFVASTYLHGRSIHRSAKIPCAKLIGAWLSTMLGGGEGRKGG